MTRDPRMKNLKVTFEYEPYTQEAWDEHVDALTDVIDEMDAEKAQAELGRMTELQKEA